MTKAQIKNVLAIANETPPWDNGIGEQSTLAARRPANDDANDFEFSPHATSGQPAAQPAAPLPPAAPLTVTERAEVAQSPAPRATAPAPRSLKPAPMLHHDKEQPGLVCPSADRQRFAAWGIWPGSAPEREPSNPFIARVIRSAPVKAALAAAKAEQKAFAKTSAETVPLTEIEPQKAALRKLLEAASDIATITKLRNDAALLDSPEAEVARQSALRIVKTAHVKLDTALLALVDAVSVELEKLVPEIESSEVDLFAPWGFPHCTTPLMAKLRAVQARMTQHRESLALARTPEFARHIGGDGGHIFATFEA